MRSAAHRGQPGGIGKHAGAVDSVSVLKRLATSSFSRTRVLRMHFSRNGDWYHAHRITGPSHNLLALRFDEPDAAGLVVEPLSVSNEPPAIEADDVQRQVLAGIAEANLRLGTSYNVAAIRFVATDTPSPKIYNFLAKAIVEHAKASSTSLD